MSASAVDAASVVQVTPGGLSPQVWETVLVGAPSWDPGSVGDGTLLVLSAHPDDETIGFGRSIARWGRRSGPVDLVSLTAGEACLDAVSAEPDSPRRQFSRSAIADLRRDEFGRAGAALNVRSARCRDLPDSALTDRRERVAAEIERAIARSQPVLIAAPWAADPHPDHAAAGGAAAEAAARHGIPLVEYPIWASFWQPPPTDPATSARLCLVPFDDLDDEGRASALRCYPSQYASFFAGLGPIVPESLLDHHRRAFAFRPTESAEQL